MEPWWFSKMLAQAFYGGTKDHALHGMPNVRMRHISGVDRLPDAAVVKPSHSFGATANADMLRCGRQALNQQAPTMHVVLLGLSQAIVVVAKMGTQTGALWKRSCYGEIVLRCCVGEIIEPRRQRLYILRVDRRAAPDPKAGRRIAIGANIIGDFFFSRGSQVISQRKPGHPARAR